MNEIPRVSQNCRCRMYVRTTDERPSALALWGCPNYLEAFSETSHAELGWLFISSPLNCLIVIVLDVGRNHYGIEICCASSSCLCLIVMPLNSFCSHDFPSTGCLINQVWRFAQSVARTFSSPAIITKYLVQTIVHA